MELVKAGYEIIAVAGNTLTIEYAGRTCYKSESKISKESSEKFVKMILQRGHESVIEHSMLSVRFIVDRGVSHEIVRHRLCAFSQESTRYCNYKGGVTFIIPPWVEIQLGEYPSYNDVRTKNPGVSEVDAVWASACASSENHYLELVKQGWKPEQARTVLHNSTKTEIVWTANFREWRHIFSLRSSEFAHPQMREVIRPLLEDVKLRVPVIFDDITY